MCGHYPTLGFAMVLSRLLTRWTGDPRGGVPPIECWTETLGSDVRVHPHLLLQEESLITQGDQVLERRA